MKQAKQLAPKNANNFEAFHEHFQELFETLQSAKSGGASPMLIQALAALSEANNIMAEQSNRINALENLVVTDELTTILNRRGLSLEMSKELNRVGRNLSNGGIFVITDLDGFKQINDQHGHPAGDACLIAVSNFLRKTLRSTDIISRPGGDEFIFVLTNIDEQMGIRRVQQILHGLEKLSFDWQDHRLSISASYGFVFYGKESNDIDSLIATADQSLYTMKQQRKAEPIAQMA